VDTVLGVSMAPTAVRLVLIEGANADGVTVEQDNFEVAAAGTSGAADQVIAAIIGTREGADEWGCQLTSTGVTWTDPAQVAALRDELAAHDVGSVMLLSPLLAAAALAQTVGHAIGYQHIAMLFVEPGNATLAVVEVADGSIVDLHRQPLENARQGAIAAELAVMVAGLDVRGSRADGVFLIGCGADIVSLKPALEAAISLDVTAPEEPDMALARGAALASANAPLFASTTAALAYSLDPGTGEVNPRALTPTYLDVCANADLGDSALAYSALDDEDDKRMRRRMPLVMAGSALAAASAIVAGVVLVSLTSDVRPSSALRPSPRGNVVAPTKQVPPQVPAPVPPPAQAQLPAPSPPPPAPTEVAAPPSPPPVEQQTPHTPVNMAPATPIRRAPTRRATEAVPTHVQQAPAPAPAAPPPSPPAVVPAPPPAAPVAPTQPPLTMYLHFPFVTIPIPLTPPPPPPPAAPPPEPAP
jgi:hypothetical protein